MGGQSGKPLTPHSLGTEIMRGRAVAAIINLGIDIVLVPSYFLSGCSATNQLPIWRDILKFLVTLELPFIVGGDMQVPPDELRPTGLLKLIPTARSITTSFTRLWVSIPTIYALMLMRFFSLNLQCHFA